MKTVKLTALLVAIAIIVNLFAGCALLPTATGSPGPDVVKQAWDIINREYVEPSRIDSANMTQAAIEGIIGTLHDPYTTYLTPEEYQLAQSSFSGQFEGIGAVVSSVNGTLVIVRPFEGSPAEKAGIKAGDIIEAINGEPTAGMTVDIAVSKIRGPAGTTVKLLVLHQGQTEPAEIEITRAAVEVPSVLFEMRGEIAYLQIAQFSQNTETELAPDIKLMQSANATGIVLDMRGNPGGLLDIVVQVASHFITDGIIVQVRSNQGVVSTESVVKGEDTTDLPMVVLVDSFSASGAEVLSGALQDHQRALIAGNTTYGKGSVNYLHQLDDGSGLYITTARWLTPNGRLIEGEGIQPDVNLTLTGEDEITWAIDYLQSRH